MTSPHLFVRISSDIDCHLCFNKWNSPDGTTNKCYSCSTCGLKVHSGCKLLCGSYFPICDSKNCTTQRTNFSFIDRVIEGCISVKLLHAYDITISAGSTLYGVFTLPIAGDYATVRSSSAITAERACVWSADNPADDEKSHFIVSKLYSFDEDESKWTLTFDLWTNYLRSASIFTNALLILKRMELQLFW